MNKKKILFIIIGLIILLLVGGGIFSIIKNKDADKLVINDINNSYDKLESSIVSYNGTRSKLIELLDGYFSIYLERDYDKFIEILGDEKDLLDNILKEVEKLDNLCLDRLFKDKDVNDICNNYKAYYETVYNVYVNDVNKINEYIVEYNNQNNKNLDTYSSVEINYIDYDKDGIYLEKEDSNNES